jgi:NagD protein
VSYFIDVQGTLIDDLHRQPVRGSREFIDHLNNENIPYMVITNNTKRKSGDFLAYLNGIGLNIPSQHYLDPLMLLKTALTEERVAAYGSEPFLRIVESLGYRLDYEDPESVLIAIKEDFSADEYAQMIEFLLAGSRLVGMHETALYAKNSKRYPGVGAILKMLQFATSASYEVLGKPGRAFYNEALKLLRLQDNTASFNEVTIISDDVKGDLAGAKELGMKTAFVLSGKYRSADEIIPYLDPQERPDGVYSDMQAYRESL